jgi:hypothetical protein
MRSRLLRGERKEPVQIYEVIRNEVEHATHTGDKGSGD